MLFAGSTCTFAQTTIDGYEYWFNNDFANKTTTSVTPTQHLLINQNILTTGLSDGFNTFNFRSYDNVGKYSSVLSHFFYKTSAIESNTNPEVIRYEYWLDNDYANVVTVNTTVQQQVNINNLISMSTLSNGVHNFNIRFKDNTGLWSTVVSHFFYITPLQIVTQNMIIEYRYWFDNDFANAVYSPLTPNQQINLIDNLDITQLPNGNHDIHFQFKDNKGLWSVVTTDNIEQIISVNILSNSFDKNIVIYPNPAVGFLYIDFGSQLNDVRISITDINGKTIQHLQYNSGQTFNIDLNTYQSGVYFITLMTEKGKATYRVIKN